MKTIRKITTLALAMLLILECFAGAALATTPDAAEEPLVAVDEAMAEVESSEPEVTEAESVEPEIQLITVQAEAKASVVESGTCGENLSWELNSDGLLTISGEGKMDDFIYSGGESAHFKFAPWRADDDLYKAVKKVVIESGVTYVGDYAFCELPNLTSASIATSVQAFGNGVFCGDGKLAKVNIPDGVTSIPKSMFSDCFGLKSISIPDSVTQIGESAFETCGFTSIKLPSGLTEISGRAFQFSALTSIVIPEGVTAIDQDAFNNCEKLKSITLPKSLLTISPRAFQDSAIVTITIPENVTHIGNNALSCSDLKTIYFTGNAPDMDPYVFEYTTATAYYPKANTTWTNAVLQDYGGNITWSAQTPLVITRQPESVTVKYGQKAAVTVEAEGTDLTYQWYIAKKGSSKFYKSSITTNTYKTTMTDSVDGRKVYCVITDKDGKTVKSNTVTLSLETTPLVITKQPESVTVKYGENAKVTVAAEGDGLTYQWYFAKKGSTKFSKASITKAAYSVEMNTSRDGRQLYCVIKDKYGKSVKTDVVTINLEKTPLEIVTQPVGVTTRYGKTATVSVKAQGDGLTYQWYYAKKGSTKFSKASITKATYSVEMNTSRDGRQLYCVITDAYGNSAKTDVVAINLEKVPFAITKQPENVTVKYGQKASVSVEAEGDGLTYQWYFAAKGSKKFKKASITKATYSVEMNASRNGRKVYCVITDAYGKTKKTDTVTLSYEKVPFAITKQPESVKVKYGQKATVTVEAEGDGLTYQWYYAKKGSSKFSKASIKTATYSVKMDKNRDGRKVYCVITDAYGKTKKTKTVTLTLEKTPLKIVDQTLEAALAPGESRDLIIEAQGDGLTYQWYLTKTAENYTKFYKSSVTSNVYHVTMTAEKHRRRFYCVVTDVYGNSVKSDTIWIYID